MNQLINKTQLQVLGGLATLGNRQESIILGRKHRLTDMTMDKLQTNYGKAIRANVKPGVPSTDQQKEQIKIMERAIMAVLYHSCDVEPEKRHQFCPGGEDSFYI